MGRDCVWLAYCGSVASVMMYAVSSHCIHHLPEVLDDMFYVTSRATPVSKSIKRHSPAHYCKTTLFTRALPRPTALAMHPPVPTSVEKSAVCYRAIFNVTYGLLTHISVIKTLQGICVHFIIILIYIVLLASLHRQPLHQLSFPCVYNKYNFSKQNDLNLP